MPWPEIGSKHDAASPTAMHAAAMRRRSMCASRPAAARGGPSGRADATVRADVAGLPQRRHPALELADARAPAPGRCRSCGRRRAGRPGIAAVYHQPSGTASIISPSPSSAASANSTKQPTSRSSRRGAGRARETARRRGRSRRSRSGPSRARPLRSVARQPPSAERERDDAVAHAGGDARAGRIEHHRVEARAVEPPADLPRVEEEFVAAELGRAPGAQRAVGRAVPVGGEARPTAPRCSSIGWIGGGTVSPIVRRVGRRRRRPGRRARPGRTARARSRRRSRPDRRRRSGHRRRIWRGRRSVLPHRVERCDDAGGRDRAGPPPPECGRCGSPSRRSRAAARRRSATPARRSRCSRRSTARRRRRPCPGSAPSTACRSRCAPLRSSAQPVS